MLKRGLQERPKRPITYAYYHCTDYYIVMFRKDLGGAFLSIQQKWLSYNNGPTCIKEIFDKKLFSNVGMCEVCKKYSITKIFPNHIE